MRTLKLHGIAIILVMFQVSLFSQNFIDETKQWAIVSTQSMDTNLKHTTYYKFSGDSIINGFTYHKLFKSTDSSQLNWSLNDCPLWFERNDSVFKLGHCCGYQIDTTTLVYDFNLEEGDSFPYFYNQYMFVDSIKYLEWGGSIRKFLFFNQYGPHPYNCITWVEGVGNLENFSYSGIFCIGSVGWELLCFHEDGNLIYQNPYYNSCYIATSADIIKESSEKSVNIFQSGNGALIINNPNSEKGMIVFYSIDGRQIKELKIESENTQVDLRNSGMIIYKFTNLYGKTQTGKFLNVLP